MPSSNRHKEYLSFQVAEKMLAIPTAMAREVFQLTNLTVVPMTPPLLLGLTSLRGSVLPVFDLLSLWENKRRRWKQMKFRCIAVNHGKNNMAILCDRIGDIIALNEEHRIFSADEISDYSFQKDGMEIIEIDLDKLQHLAAVVIKRELKRKGVAVA